VALDAWARHSNGKGVTALELLELIRSNSYTSTLECNGEALQETMDTKLTNANSTDRSSYKRALEQLINRLSDVERHGYTPPKLKNEDIKNFDGETTQQKQQQIQQSNADGTVATKKKKKKKKKTKEQAPATPAKSPESRPMEAPAPAPVAQHDSEDPLITALLGMGFSADKISAAAKALGGTDRATADDMVMWIIENESGGGDGGGSSNDDPAQDDRVSDRSGDNNISDTKRTSEKQDSSNAPQESAATQMMFQHQQRLAAQNAAQAHKEAMEAARRKQEAHAAAMRLAEKREEQRRIRREWNNREQVRQREEAQARLAEEMEQRRRLEIERAKTEAQRLVRERAATQQQQQLHVANAHVATGRMAIPQQQAVFTPSQVLQPGVQMPPVGLGPHGSPTQPPARSSNLHHQQPGPFTGSTPSAMGGASQYLHQQPPPVVPVTHSHDTYQGQMMPMAGAAPGMNFPPQQHSGAYSPVHAMDPAAAGPYMTNMTDVHGGGHYAGPVEKVTSGRERKASQSKKEPPPALEVNAFDFPELGKEKEQPPPRARSNRSKSMGEDGSGGKQRQSRGKQRNSRQPRNGPNSPTRQSKGRSASSASSSSPPGFRTTSAPVVTTPISTMPPEMPPAVEEEPNPLGEIRATAREFVPLNFKPPPAPPVSTTPAPSVAPVSTSPAPPPGLVGSLMVPSMSAQSNASSAFPPALSMTPEPGMTADSAAAAALLEPVNSLLSAPPQHTSNSILASMSNTLLANDTIHIDRAANATPTSTHSPIHSAASSITGISGIMGDDHGTSRIGSVMSFDSGSLGGNGGRTTSILDSLPLGGGGGSSIPLGGIERHDTNPLSAAMAASSIWGGTSSGTSGLGGLSAFNFRETGESSLVGDLGDSSILLGSSILGDGGKRDDNGISSTWGTNGDSLGGVAPNNSGSIW